jgi:predicted HTH domain antitoxin
MSTKNPRQVTKSVRFDQNETRLIAEISRREHLPEGTLLRKLVLDGLAEYRLEHAISDYEAGELNLGEAAARAGVSVERMMAALRRRGIDLISPAHFAESLEHLMDSFGERAELRDTIATLRDRHANG